MTIDYIYCALLIHLLVLLKLKVTGEFRVMLLYMYINKGIN